MEPDTREVAHLRELVLEMFSARDRALNTAYSVMNARLDSMNEFRVALSDQTARFITRSEHEALASLITATDQQVRINTQRLSTIEQIVSGLAPMATRVATLESRLYLGGAGMVVVLTVAQLLLNYWHLSAG